MLISRQVSDDSVSVHYASRHVVEDAEESDMLLITKTLSFGG